VAYPYGFGKGGLFLFLMPDNLRRITGLGDLHFITLSCYQHENFLASAGNRNIAVQILGEVRARFKFALVGYVLMPDHVHLLVSEPAGASPAKRDSSTAQADTFAGANAKEKASACSARNDNRGHKHAGRSASAGKTVQPGMAVPRRAGLKARHYTKKTLGGLRGRREGREDGRGGVRVDGPDGAMGIVGEERERDGEGGDGPRAFQLHGAAPIY